MPGALTGGPGIFYNKRFKFSHPKITNAGLTEVKIFKMIIDNIRIGKIKQERAPVNYK